MTDENKKQLTKLYDLDAEEVSLVPYGAIKKKFLVLKSGGVMPGTIKDLHDAISKTDPAVMDKVEAHLIKCGIKQAAAPAPAPAPAPEAPKAPTTGDTTTVSPDAAPLDSQSEAAIKAIVRILSAIKGKVDPVVMHEILEIAGFQVSGKTEAEPHAEGSAPETKSPEAAPADAEKTAPPPDEKTGEKTELPKENPPESKPIAVEEDKEKTEKEGNAAGAQIPEKDVKVKEVNKEASEDDIKKGCEAGESAYKAHMEKLGYQKYPPAQMMMKSAVKKEEVTEPAQVVPEPTETEKVAIQKAADLEVELKKRDEAEAEKVLIEKAASWKSLTVPQVSLVEQLRMAKKFGNYDLVCKNFDMLDRQLGESKLFEEKGTNVPSENKTEQAILARMEQAAKGFVQKSGDKYSTYNDGYNAFLNTEEGRKLYAEYLQSRGGI